MSFAMLAEERATTLFDRWLFNNKLLGTLEWFVIQHTNCGLGTITDEVMGELLEETLQTAEFKDGSWRNTGNELGSTEGHHVKWLTIQNPQGKLCARMLNKLPITR